MRKLLLTACGIAFSLSAGATSITVNVQSGPCWIKNNDTTLTGVSHKLSRDYQASGIFSLSLYDNRFTVERVYKNAENYFASLPPDLMTNITLPISQARKLSATELKNLFGGTKLSITGRFREDSNGQITTILDDIYLRQTNGQYHIERYFLHRVGNGLTPSLNAGQAVENCKEKTSQRAELCDDIFQLNNFWTDYFKSFKSILNTKNPDNLMGTIKAGLNADRCLLLEQQDAFGRKKTGDL